MKNIALATLFSLFLTGSPVSASQGYKVLSIGDGDTIRVTRDSETITIRLACIDAPEMQQKPHGSLSRRELLSALPLGSEVTLRTFTNDRYGRVVAEVFVDGGNINLGLVRTGSAFTYRDYLAKCDRDSYLTAEQAAKKDKLGVWAQSEQGIMRPWTFRRQSGRYSSNLFTCEMVGTRARAQELYNQGHTYLDSNKDGIPCNSLRK